MSHSALILLSHQRQLCWQQQGRQWQAVTDLEQLAPETPVSVVCDLANEHCQRLQLPPLSRRHRQLLLERQLSQQWPQSRWRTSLPSLARRSRFTSGPSAEALNFSLFGMDETPPLQALLQHPRLRVVALYPLSLLILSLSPAQAHRQWLLIALSHGAQLRILALDHGVLVVNRLLSELSEPGAQAHEVERTRRYLESQFGLSRESGCQLMWLGAQQETLALLDGANLQHLPPPGGWQAPEALCSAARLHELMRRAPACMQLLTGHHGHVTHLPWLNRAAAACLLSAATTIAALHWQTQESAQHIAALNSQLTLLTQQQQAMAAQLATQPVTLEQLQQLQAWEARAQATPALLRQHLLQLTQELQLDQHRRVHSLSWQLNDAACASSHDDTLARQHPGQPDQPPPSFAELRFQLVQLSAPDTPQPGCIKLPLTPEGA